MHRLHVGVLVAGCLLAGGPPAVAQQDLSSMTENPSQWVMTGRTYDLQRYSPLTQINTTTVAHLHPVWRFSTGTLRGHEGNPLVINNVMYVYSPFPNKVYALDLTKDGAPQMWQYTPDQDTAAMAMACCDVVNRGLAFHPATADHPGGILYIELLQGDLLALDARTGKKIYQVQSADFHKGETMTNGLLVVRDVVITGVSGAFGVRGRVTGYSALDGHELWRAYGPGSRADGYSYDPEVDLFYYGSGSSGPWNPDQRLGDRGWSNTIWAREPETGEARWTYQVMPHEAWDREAWDDGDGGANDMVLAELSIKGKLTKVLMHFDRNGFAYTLDRTNGKVLVVEPYGPVNRARGMDVTAGPSAYSPKTHFSYVLTNSVCSHCGAFIAWDPTVGKIVWSDTEELAAYGGGGALATAGDVVFYGTMEGWLKAVDAYTGKLLWKYKTPSGIIGNPMTYIGPDGRQYIAILSGLGSALGAFGDVGSFTTQGGVLTVFALDNGGKTTNETR